MSRTEQAMKSKKMAADMVKRGIYHGRRMTKPFANSGGLTMSMEAGSSKYQRLMQRRYVRRTVR